MKNQAAVKIRNILIILSLFYGIAVFADFFAPYTCDFKIRSKSYMPPVKIHFVDNLGKFNFRPFIYDVKSGFDENYKRVFVEDKTKAYPLKFLVKGESYKFLGLFESSIHLFGVEGPVAFYLLGADALGRDVFSRICFSLRISLSVGIIGILLSYSTALFFGGVAGYFGGRIDFIIMRFCEMLMLLPGFYIMLALRASFPPDLSSLTVYILVVCIFSLIGFAGSARVIRGMVHSIKCEEFVIAAKALGTDNFSIIFKHILPQTFSYVIISATMSMPAYILGEAALSMLGLGITEPTASLGNMLSDSLNIAEISFHSWLLTPALVIVVIVIVFNMLGERIRDYYNKRVW